MDWRRLPSLSALRAFSAVAEKKSFSSAGRELNVTHAAVSQQVRGLEGQLGTQLVVREGRGLGLTSDGEHLAAGLRDAFAGIYETVEDLRRNDEERPLNITMTPSFAVSWLMPRISDFRQENPHVELMLNPTADVVEFAPGGVDLAIRFGNGDWPGLESQQLLASNYVVVGAHKLLGDRELTDPSDIQDFPWLQELGTNELSIWLEGQGVVPRAKLNITHLPGYMVLDGLRRGDGISATARVFVENDIQAGTLRVLFEDMKPQTSGYYLVRKPGVPRPPLKAFITWIRQRAREAEACCAASTA
ncbi:LysR family transcriptional regulator [Roseibium polysiphoniae]|uniref:LysR family transcriptional regulator n=1 Tax=Roseibium polysiphoniae TaxID=2571221 RepID=A0A944CAV2_9HYPH|nr:LysR family transcriptional regulator [Roseibium polysiphoniae]MBS8258886.1 LysR family transcriptional regulator [Roseibium polysiphoniae]